MKKQICSWLLALSPILLLCQSQARADHFSNAGLWPPNLGSDHLCLVIAAHL